MSEMLIEFLKTLDIGQLISLILISWFFYGRLNNKIDKLDKNMKDCCILKEERHHKKAS